MNSIEVYEDKRDHLVGPPFWLTSGFMIDQQLINAASYFEKSQDTDNKSGKIGIRNKILT